MKGFRKAMKSIAFSLAVTLVASAMPMNVQAETSGNASTTAAITDADFLKASGKNLVNQNGEVVNLRGTNAGGYLLQEFWMTPTAYTDQASDESDIYRLLTERFGKEEMLNIIDVYQDAYWTEADFDNCARLGMNCIRLPFWWRNLVDENGVFYGYEEAVSGSTEVAATEVVATEVVATDVSSGNVSGNDVSGNNSNSENNNNENNNTNNNNNNNNSNVSSDPYAVAFERMDWFVQEAGERGMYVIIDFHGAPGSQNGSDHSGVDGGDAKEAASEFFFGDNAAANQELYYDMWEVIAERYKDNPIVAGYDLLNEPYCTYRYNSKLNADELHTMLWNIYDKAYDVIRSVDPNHVIIMEATWDPVDLPNPAQYGWENIMYEYHNYLYDDYDNANGQQIANMQTKLNAIGNADYNVPSYMGEFSYFNQPSAWDEGLELLVNSGMNWTTWTYKTTADYGMWGHFHHPEEFNNKINIATASKEEILAWYARMGETVENTTLTNVTSKWYQAETVANTLGPKYAEIEDGDYYLVGNNTMKVLTSDASTGLVAATEDAKNLGNGTMKPFTLVNNDDGTISFKTADGKYISVSKTDNKMYATATAVGETEKFTALVVSATTVAFKSVATDTYVSVVSKEDADVLDVLVQSYAITGDESFQLYDKDLALVGSVKLDTYSGWSRFESEDTEVASFHNGVTLANDVAEYSGGYAAGSMDNNSVTEETVADDWSNIKYVKYTVDAPEAGEYLLSLNYNGNDDKKILVKTNDGENQVVSVPWREGGQWYTLYEQVITVELQKGTNEIYISGTLNNTGWINIDCIDIINAPLAENDVYTRYEAEDYFTNAAVKSQSHFSGGLGVEDVNSDTKLEDVAFNWANIKYVDFTIYAEEAGEYTVVWGYTGAGTNGMTALYRLNKGENQVITLDNAGGNWNIPSTYTFTVNLEKGFNSLQLSGTIIDTGHYANIDYIDVKPSSVLETPKGPSGWSHLEAESATIVGGNKEAQDFYSLACGVGGLNVPDITPADVKADWSNINYVAFDVEAPRAGDYRLVMAYNGDDDKVGMVKVNDGESQVIDIPAVTSEHTWNLMHEKEIIVTLKEGENTIYISGAIGSGWYNIDYIEICNSEMTIVDEATQTERYEAEFYNTKSGNNPAVEVQNGELVYSGPLNQGVGGMGTQNTSFVIGTDVVEGGLNYTNFTIYASEAGDYTVKVACNGNGANMQAVYQLNDNESKHYDIKNEGAAWSTVCIAEFTVTLEKGFNQLLITGPYDNWSNWLNFDYIDVAPVVEEGDVTITPDPEAEVQVTLPEAGTVKDAVLSDEDKERVENGEDIVITLTVDKVEKDSNDADQKLAETNKGKLTIGCFLDITLLKKIGNDNPTEVEETKSDIKITIQIPADLLKSGRTFYVLRVHDGVVKRLTDNDSADGTITITTDKFSTYALAYEDTTTEGGNNTPGGGNNNTGDNNTGGNTQNPGNNNNTTGNGGTDNTGKDNGSNTTVNNNTNNGTTGGVTTGSGATTTTTDNTATITGVTSSPKTGDNNFIVWALLILAVGTVIVIGTKVYFLKKEADDVA